LYRRQIQRDYETSGRALVSKGQFRSFTVNLAKPDEFVVELQSGIMVREVQPHRYNIQFHDTETQREIQDILKHVQQRWNNFTTMAVNLKGINDPTAIKNAVAELSPRLHEEFSKKPEFTDAFSKLGRLCYWEKGDYRMMLSFKTARPDKTFSKTWYFSLTDGDAELLRMNVVTVLAGTCEQKVGNVLFVWPLYRNAL
jgi:hypothetical protein